MDENDIWRAGEDGLAEDLRHADDCRVHVALVDHHDIEHAHAGVQEDDSQLLLREHLHLRREQRHDILVRPNNAAVRLAVSSAILNLGDRASLEFNPVAQLPLVGRLADERYPGKIWRRGLWLRDLVNEAISDTIEAADGDDMAKFRWVLTCAASGCEVSSIAAEIGIRRESLSRGLWSQITAVVWARLKRRLQALES